MGEKRSNHTVYNVNYHFVWCPKYRHSILELIEESLKQVYWRNNKSELTAYIKNSKQAARTSLDFLDTTR